MAPAELRRTIDNIKKPYNIAMTILVFSSMRAKRRAVHKFSGLLSENAAWKARHVAWRESRYSEVGISP